MKYNVASNSIPADFTANWTTLAIKAPSGRGGALTAPSLLPARLTRQARLFPASGQSAQVQAQASHGF
ncbi:hypothetical protein RRG08_037617 [Elysia crispata]|uniref:Uncharacterized protein n=1 Tax=Elysia crispata TaxID=231223 RepID=A0AAE0YGK2_9GAST|nr:hypothetical protein RRG08_037617 [Elysia crispata]